MTKTTTAGRFWARVNLQPGAEWGCWEWTGYRNARGYGQFSVDGRRVTAHRYAWALFNGEIPPGLCVCHSCDNPPCCNPAHLWVGTNADNIADRERKGRGRFGWAINKRAKTHCPKGHPYSGDNLYVSPRGDRVCRTCMRFRESQRPRRDWSRHRH